jgi:intracellular septation protein
VIFGRWCVEFGPVITFVVAYRLSDFFRATAALMAATTAGLLLAVLRERRIPLFPLLYSASVLCFGAFTLWSREAGVLMLQDTLAGAGFAAMLLLSLAVGRPLLKRLFDPLFALTDAGWRILSVRWGGWFLLYALGNELVRTGLSESAWVRFKAWGLVATAAFGCYQFTVARRERLADASNSWGMRVVRELRGPQPDSTEAAGEGANNVRSGGEEGAR